MLTNIYEKGGHQLTFDPILKIDRVNVIIVQSQMYPNLFNIILKIIMIAPRRFQISIFCIWEIFFKKDWELFIEML